MGGTAAAARRGRAKVSRVQMLALGPRGRPPVWRSRGRRGRRWCRPLRARCTRRPGRDSTPWRGPPGCRAVRPGLAQVVRMAVTWLVACTARAAWGAPVAHEVHAHHGSGAREEGDQRIPHHLAARHPVNQDEGGTGAAASVRQSCSLRCHHSLSAPKPTKLSRVHPTGRGHQAGTDMNQMESRSDTTARVQPGARRTTFTKE